MSNNNYLTFFLFSSNVLNEVVINRSIVNEEITGAAGDKFTAGDLGEYEVTEASDGGTEVILGSPFKFDPSNIDEWKDVY